MSPPARTPGQRKADALRRLDSDTDAWVATAGPDGGSPYLVPLSFLWDGASVLIATPADSPTGRNLRATGTARLGIGPTRAYFRIRPQRLQTWREVNELPGRDLMRDGDWVAG